MEGANAMAAMIDTPTMLKAAPLLKGETSLASREKLPAIKAENPIP